MQEREGTKQGTRCHPRETLENCPTRQGEPTVELGCAEEALAAVISRPCLPYAYLACRAVMNMQIIRDVSDKPEHSIL